MAAEIKKEIELEIAHVLFMDIVGYSKLPINPANEPLVERLNEIVRGTDEFHIAGNGGAGCSQSRRATAITLVFIIALKRRLNARWK